MKLIYSLLNQCRLLALVLLIVGTLAAKDASAQVCSDPINIIYGLSGNGSIYPININGAIVGSALNQNNSGNSPSSSNGLGYNPVNGKFYYFKRNTDQSPQEFVSYDPLTDQTTILSSCPTTFSINTGCVSFDGSGYYGLNANGNLYKFDIISNSWILITSTFYDQWGTDITAILRARNSGDIALDGLGNLWLLCSSNTQYGLYKFTGPLPAGNVASLTGKQIISPLTATPNNKNFAGIAFNPTGQIFISGGTGDNYLYRLENNLSLTNLGVMNINGAGRDLTSCSFPFMVLPVTWENFTAVLEKDQHVLLSWTVGQEQSNKAYSIEHSMDGNNWEEIGIINSNSNSDTVINYSFTHINVVNGNHFYRIRQNDFNGNYSYSTMKMITIKSDRQVAVWPNPARDILHIQNLSSNTNGLKVWLFDLSGKMVNEAVLYSNSNTINISSFPFGTYVVKVQLANGESYNQKLLKN